MDRMYDLTLFDTEGIRAQQRPLRWGEFICRQNGRLEVHPLGGGNLAGTIARRRIGEIELLRVTASAHRLSLSAQASHVSGRVRVVVQLRGEATFHQGGGEVRLKPGQWTIWFTDRPHSVVNDGEVEQLVALLPLQLLGIPGTGILRHARTRMGDRPGIGQMIPQYLGSLFDHAALVDPEFHWDLVDIAAHHIRLAIEEASASVPREAMRDTMRTRVIDYIRHHLRDADLSIERIAVSLGCSKRNIHKVFRSTGTTVSQFVWNERLERCRDALDNPGLARRSVTEIAFMWGFNNSSHFSRMFKSRFGQPPGRWRSTSLRATRPFRPGVTA